LDEAGRRARQRAGKKHSVVDPHQRLVTGVDGREVRRPVIPYT